MPRNPILRTETEGLGAVARPPSLTQTNTLRRDNSLIPVRYKRSPEATDDIKEEFLDCLSRCHTGTSGLRAAILRAMAAGLTREQIAQWGVAAGYPLTYTRNVISLAMLKCGARSRKSGAGRKTPKEALEILFFAEKAYGEKAGKYLRAAYRAFRKGRQSQGEEAANP